MAGAVACNPRLLEHEEGHTWQYLYCLGLPFYLAYGVCLAWSMLRTGDRAARNFFERSAGLVSGGYEDKPIRPIGENVRAMIAQLRKSVPLSPKPVPELVEGLSRRAQSMVRSMPSRLAERNRWRAARSRRSRLTSKGSWARASGLSINAFSTW